MAQIINPGDSLTQITNKLKANDDVRWRAGTYNLGSGGLELTGVKGTQSNPILWEEYGDGPVIITSSQVAPDPANTDDQIHWKRTLQLIECEWITILGLEIINGLSLRSSNPNLFNQIVGDRNPNFIGIKTFNPDGYKQTLLNGGLKPSRNITIRDCITRQRGISFISAFECLIETTQMLQIIKNSGGGVKGAQNFSCGVRACRIELSASGTDGKHWHNEGIRNGDHACYNWSEDNTIIGGPPIARGIGNDVISSWNRHSRNQIDMQGGNMGLSEQAGSWNNIWEDNIVENADNGMGIGKYTYANMPTQDRLINKALIRRNDLRTSLGNGQSMLMRGVKNCVFTNNRANQVQDGAANRPTNFGAFGNTWNGSSTLPNNPIPDPGPTPIPTPAQSRSVTPTVASWFVNTLHAQVGAPPGPVAQSSNLNPVNAFWFVNPIGAPPTTQSRTLAQIIAAWFVSPILYELETPHGPTEQFANLNPVRGLWWVNDMVAVYVFISFPDSSNDPPLNEGDCECV